MNKRYLHHWLTRLRAVPLRYVAAVCLILSAVAIIALRQNNLHMLTLKQAVYSADKDNGDTQKALQNLQHYVTQHMNTDLSGGQNTVYPPIQLKYTYDRLVQAESAKLAQANSQVYTDAQAYCEQQNPTDFSGHNRVPCITQYVQTHGSTGAPTFTVPDSLYKFDFVSPKWSPDLAGWSLVLAILSFLGLVVLAGLRYWLKLITK